MIKKIIPIVIALAIIIAAIAACVMFFCRETNYEAHYTEDNLLGTVKADDKELSVYFFRISGGTAVMDLVSEDFKVFQRMEIPTKNEYYASLDYEDSINLSFLKDMNFDGATDIYLACSVTTPNCEGMAWLWNADKNEFVLSKEISKLPCVEVDEKAKVIKSTDYLSPEAECISYEWKGGKLVAAD